VGEERKLETRIQMAVVKFLLRKLNMNLGNVIGTSGFKLKN
jgi:hypothetical protein